jgi:hypothetical protein
MLNEKFCVDGNNTRVLSASCDGRSVNVLSAESKSIFITVSELVTVFVCRLRGFLCL